MPTEKNSIWIVYREILGYINQLPTTENSDSGIYEKQVWETYNDAVQEIVSLTDNTALDRFKINEGKGQMGPYVSAMALRTKISGLVSRLHAQYFNHEEWPFSRNNGMTINQNQNINLAIELQDKIASAMSKAANEPERKFLEEIDQKLRNINSVVQAFNIILSTAEKVGLTISSVLHLIK